MNRIGGKSNTGEGGEDDARYRAELRTGKSRVKAGDTLASVLGRDRIEVDVPLQAGRQPALARSSRSRRGASA